MTKFVRYMAITIALALMTFAGIQLGTYLYQSVEENAVNDELSALADSPFEEGEVWAGDGDEERWYTWEDPDVQAKTKVQSYSQRLFGKAAPGKMPTGGKQTKTSITNAQKRKINFTALKKKNKDIVAWISIPNTPIDYAVLKTGNNSYYLKRNAIKKPSSSGAIFLDSAAKADFSSKDSIVYGHRMKDRTMFGSLISYKNSKHRKSHQYVFVYTPKATKKYRVSECFRTSSKKLTPKNAKVRTLSLVTCDDAKGKVHYIVRAKLVSSKKPGKK